MSDIGLLVRASAPSGPVAKNTFWFNTGAGSLAVSDGTYFVTPGGCAYVDDFGADPTGTADSAAAIQSAIDSDIPCVLFNPCGIYRVDYPIVVDSITDGNTLLQGRHIDGQGCRIVPNGSPANCFQFTDAASPNNHRHTQFHDFVFHGTVTGAFCLFTGGRAWYNDAYSLRATATSSATAVLQVHNTLADSQPGMFRIINLVSSLPATVSLTMAGGAAPQFDDFLIQHIVGGAALETGASVDDGTGAIVIGAGAVLTDSLVQNVFSGGQHAIYAANAYIENSIIQRVLLEIPSKTDYPGAEKDVNYGIYGTLRYCVVDGVKVNFPNATDNPGCRCVKAVFEDCTVRNLKMYASETAAIPYAGTTTYPALEAVEGSTALTFDFPRAYVYRGVEVSKVPGAVYLGGPLETYQNSTGNAPAWVFKGGIITNYGQGGSDCTSTLPAAAEGLSVRYVMIGDGGGDYHIKAGANDRIVLNGTPLDDADKISCAAPTLGNAVRLYTMRSGGDGAGSWRYDWMAVTEGGTWTDGGA